MLQFGQKPAVLAEAMLWVRRFRTTGAEIFNPWSET